MSTQKLFNSQEIKKIPKMRNPQIKMTFRVGHSTESPPPRPKTSAEHIYFGEGGQPIPSSEWWAIERKRELKRIIRAYKHLKRAYNIAKTKRHKKRKRILKAEILCLKGIIRGDY